MRLDRAKVRIETSAGGPDRLRRTARSLLEVVSAPFSRISRPGADNETDMLWLLLASDPDGIWYGADYLNASPSGPPSESNEDGER
jgi:hypothetical protein